MKDHSGPLGPQPPGRHPVDYRNKCPTRLSRRLTTVHIHFPYSSTCSFFTMSRENVLIFGLGGIGGVYACLLHLSQRCDVSVVARSNYAAVTEKGFRMISPTLGNHEDIRFAGGAGLLLIRLDSN